MSGSRLDPATAAGLLRLGVAATEPGAGMVQLAGVPCAPGAFSKRCTR